jgi:hypothetical protein
MLDFDLLVDISRKLHKALGSESQFEKKSNQLDLFNLIKLKEKKIGISEEYFNVLEQKRISDLKFASFDDDPKRKRNFLIHSLNIIEESITITRFDKSFNKNKKLIMYLNYLRTIKILTYQVNSAYKSTIFKDIINAIETLDTDIDFLKSWFLIFKAQIFFELKDSNSARNTLIQAKKLYFDNYSDFYFTFQNDFGKNYWDELVLKLESELK